MRNASATLATLVAIAFLGGCARPDPHAHDISAVIEHADQPHPNIGGVSSDRWLEGVASVRAEGFPETAPPFNVATREKSLTKFPCIECHNKPLETLRVTGKKDKKASHWDIRLQHGKADTLACNTCHSYEDFALLKTLANKPVAINHAYRVCAQCHSKQVNDWAGGAHGKRLGGWAPPRIAQNCAGCHNPHKPKLDSRWPAVASREAAAGDPHE